MIIKSIWQQGYFIIAGYGGLSICAISFCDSFKITLTCDDGILSEDETKKLALYIGNNVKSEIERMKGEPEIDKKKDKWENIN